MRDEPDVIVGAVARLLPNVTRNYDHVSNIYNRNIAEKRSGESKGMGVWGREGRAPGVLTLAQLCPLFCRSM